LRTSISKKLHLGPQNGPRSENLLKIVNCQNGQKTVLSHLEKVGGPRYPPGSIQKGESGSPIHISTDEQISRHFGKSSVQNERVCILKMELVEINSLLKKEEMTPRLGGSTDVILIDGQSFFSSRNAPG
jgi:hypothetical protein